MLMNDLNNHGNSFPSKKNKKMSIYCVHNHTNKCFHFSISDTLIDELINSLGSEIDFGEKSFVEDFLKQELAC